MGSLKLEFLKNKKLYGGIAVVFTITSALAIYASAVSSRSLDRKAEIPAYAGAERRVVNYNQFATPSSILPDNPAMSMPLNQLTERLAKKLEKNPNDLAGWTLLARSYSTLGQPENAGIAFEKAIALAPQDVGLRVTMGETLMKAESGQITPEARESFIIGQTIDPDHPGVRYYLALADFQAGRVQEAYDAWTELGQETPANAPWKDKIDDKLSQAAIKLGIKQ
jgi:cytochrome c-type biogenesis protein CcmH